MCVIMIADLKRPTAASVDAAFRANDAGAGIAWRDGGKVHWEKGLELDDIQRLVAQVPIPYVAHFRIPTVGGKCDELCHPFTVDRNASTALKGSTKGMVLFHNGHWTDWKQTTLRAISDFRIRMPQGSWSDSRAMALNSALYGLGVLNLIDEKAVVFGPATLEVFHLQGWVQVDEVWCSNDHWKHRTGGYNRGDSDWQKTMCKDRTCTRKDINAAGWCPQHDPAKPFLRQHDKVESRGDSTVLPFDQASRLFQAGQLSKKKFKKARRAYEEQQRRSKETAKLILH